MGTEPIDLDAAQALADAATPGPWRWGDDNDGNGNTLIRAGRRWDALANLEYTSDEDGDFICQARTLVPALIAELLEARAVIAEVKAIPETLRHKRTADTHRAGFFSNNSSWTVGAKVESEWHMALHNALNITAAEEDC